MTSLIADRIRLDGRQEHNCRNGASQVPVTADLATLMRIIAIVSLAMFLHAITVTHANAADAEESIVILTDEDDLSAALLAARTMALRMEVITNAPVEFIMVDALEGDLLEKYLELPADGRTILMLSSRHILELARTGEVEQLKDVRPLARAISIPQIIVMRCGHFMNVEQIVNRGDGREIRFGIIADSELENIAARSFWRHVGESVPLVSEFRNHQEVIIELLEGEIDLAIMNYTIALDYYRKGRLCPLILLSEELLAELPEVETTWQHGIMLSMQKVWGYLIHASVDDEVVAELEKVLLESMNNVTYSDLLKYAGLNSWSVANSEDWGQQILATVDTMLSGLELLPQHYSNDE